MEEDSAVGAEVAVIPRGFAGDDVGMGESMGQAAKVPGIVKPPYAAPLVRLLTAQEPTQCGDRAECGI